MKSPGMDLLVALNSQTFHGVAAFALVFGAAIASPVNSAAGQGTNEDVAIVALENSLVGTAQQIRSFHVTGDVCAVLPGRNMIALRDSSGCALLELPSLDPSVAVGDRLAIAGRDCLLMRTRFGLQMGAVPVVEDDGVHSAVVKSGQVFLPAGVNPIHVQWFNALGDSALRLEYEGPGVSRQRVPATALSRDAAGTQPGVNFSAYEGDGWGQLPDFSRLSPVAVGSATNFSTTYRTRAENCALVFNGFLRVVNAGIFTFHLTSDDGARLLAGSPSVTSQIIKPREWAAPAPAHFERALADRAGHQWVELAGEVTFASENQRSLELEMAVGDHRVPVTVVDGTGLSATNLLHRWLRGQGICEFSGETDEISLAGVFVPGARQVTLYNSAEEARHSADVHIATATQVRRLKPEEAARHLPAKIRGVVIYSLPTAAVLQDATGGIFISPREGVWNVEPKVGELWEIEGATDPGDFSPVIIADTARCLGAAALPEPIRPTRDQLMNGNLDAEYIELHGVLTSVSSGEMTLLTPDGKVTVLETVDRPLPQLPAPGGPALVGGIVRLRGCCATLVDLPTRQVVPEHIYLYPALVEVEEPPPADPFQLPKRKAADLMWFNARASALQRTRLGGQILFALPGEYLVLDGTTGFRVLARDPVQLLPGDWVEAVGFPRLGGPSPVLQEAQLRTTGHSALPAPVAISADNLLDRNRDSTLVRVEATLISDTVHADEQVLELQSGPRHFVARVKSGPRAFHSLPPGCRLRVTGAYASTEDDQNNIGTDLLPFEILLTDPDAIVVLQQPPWWTVRRALGAVGALAGALALTFIWVALLRQKVEQRTRQLKKEIEDRQLAEQHHAIEQERIRVAQDLHDELGAGLTEVSILGSLANTSALLPETKTRYLTEITQTARSLVTALDEIVWAVNPQYDSIGSLATYFSLFAESFLNLAGIACRPQVAEDLPDYPLDSKVRHGVFRAFKEALNNVVRHSGASEVRLIFATGDGQLLLSVIDNGRGFAFVAGAPGRDGLAGLSQRMNKLGGSCRIASQSGHGTKIEMRLPLNGIPNGQSRHR